MIVACDLDGVLASTIDSILEEINNTFNLSLQAKDVNNFSLEELLEANNIQPRWLYVLFKNEWFWGKVRPIDENISKIVDWHNRGHEIHIVTSRVKEVSIPTSAWLKRHGVPHHRLQLIPTMKKVDYLKEINAECIIEDFFYEANRCAADGFPAFVVRRPYNKDFEPRVTNPIVYFIDNLAEMEWFFNGSLS